METKLSILCENSVHRAGVIGEHGFSALVEREGETFLFDTGPGISVAFNAKAMGKELRAVDRIVLSHGHYDHTGGLQRALRRTGPTEVVAHPAVFTAHMACDPKAPRETLRHAGCPQAQETFQRRGAHFRFVEGTQEISPGVWFVGGIERRPEWCPRDPRLVLAEGERLIPDPIEDDACLLLECRGGHVLLLGCTHSGVLNVLDHIERRMGVNRLQAVVGGTHLLFTETEDIRRVIARFESFSIETVAVSHCTGWRAVTELAGHFDQRFAMASAGSTFAF
jgi:7,8-dihydropterin-6-yl-methyl-4-(beta-D-ribofuranosyl)aminobenzene 5'-phosphate synthase